MLARRESRSIQIRQGVGWCALADGVLGSVITLDAIRPGAWRVLSTTVADRTLAWGFYVVVFGIGLLVAVLPAYSTAKGWYERVWWANSLRLGSAILCAVIGLWIVLIAVEFSGVIY